MPIINTNDAVSPPMFIEHDETTPGSGSKKVSDFVLFMQYYRSMISLKINLIKLRAVNSTRLN